MKKSINPCNLYLSLWMLVIVWGELNSWLVTVYLTGFLILLSVVYFIKVNINFKLPKYFVYLNILFGVLSLYGVALLFSGEKFIISQFAEYRVVKNNGYLLSCLLSFLPIYSFYYFRKSGYLTENSIKFWIIVFFIVASFQYYYGYQRGIDQAYDLGIDIEKVYNNQGYLFVALIPGVVFFEKKPVVQYVLLGICFVFIITSLKRGSIVTGSITLLFFVRYLFKYKWSTTNRRSVFYSFLGVAILVLVGYYFVLGFYSSSVLFQNRLNDTLSGDSSGRDSIYKQIFNYLFNEASPFQLLFGSGAKATVKYFGIEAHNDWLEIAVNQGIFGIFLFVLYWLGFYKKIKTTPIVSLERFALILLFVSLFTRTLFSMSILNMSIYSTCLLGYCVGYSPTDANDLT